MCGRVVVWQVVVVGIYYYYDSEKIKSDQIFFYSRYDFVIIIVNMICYDLKKNMKRIIGLKKNKMWLVGRE